MPATPGSDGLEGTTLVLGGARSGKSMYAESLIEAAGGGIYLATATAGDEEMRRKIAAHRDRRGDGWETIEEPLDVAAALARLAGDGRQQPVLLDCLTLWLSNLMHAGSDIDRSTNELETALRAAPFPVVTVSNEVGGGIIPDTELGRTFMNRAGILNQRIAQASDHVILVTAGIPQALK